MRLSCQGLRRGIQGQTSRGLHDQMRFLRGLRSVRTLLRDYRRQEDGVPRQSLRRSYENQEITETASTFDDKERARKRRASSFSEASRGWDESLAAVGQDGNLFRPDASFNPTFDGFPEFGALRA